MNEQEPEEKLEFYVKSLDAELAPSVANKLKAARIDALSQANRSRKSWIVPALAFSSLACIGILVTGVMAPDTPGPESQWGSVAEIGDLSSDDLVLLSEGEEFELLENIEFILWLSELDDADLG